MRIDFAAWLTDEMNKRGWRNADLVERSGMSRAMVSQVPSQQRQAGLEFCVGVAKAFGIPPEDVLSRAGLIPPRPNVDRIYRIQELAERVSRLPPERQRRVMEAFLTLLEAEEIVRDIDVDQEDVLPQAAERQR